MSRPFIFRVHASELFSQIQGMDNNEKAAFITQFSVDLITLNGTSAFSKSIIEETLQFIEKKRINGLKGGRPKSERKAKVKLNESKRKAKAKPEAETETEAVLESKKDSESESLKSLAEAVKKTVQQSHKKTDEEWLEEIKSNPAYEGINFDIEIGKAQAWCMTKSRKCSRGFLLNWFNKAEKPISINGVSTRPKSFREQVNDAACDAFLRGDY